MNLGLRSEKSNECSYKEDDGPSVSEKADTAWNEHFKKHNSLIVKLFHGQMVSRLTCQGCHKVILLTIFEGLVSMQSSFSFHSISKQ